MDQTVPPGCRPSKTAVTHRNDLKFNIRIIHSNLIHKTEYTLNTGIAPADHKTTFPFFASSNASTQRSTSFFIGVVETPYPGVSIYKIHINGISDDRVTVFQGFHSDTVIWSQPPGPIPTTYILFQTCLHFPECRAVVTPLSSVFF